MKEALPPYDLDAEEAVLGSLLIDSEAITEIVVIIGPEDFFSEQNQYVFGACHNLFNRDEAINQITVAQELVRLGRLDEAGGAAYLSHLVAIVPTSLHVRHYAEINNPAYQKIPYSRVSKTTIPRVAHLNTGSWILNTPGGSSQL